MRSRIFQVDAFTDRRFAGNPAAVCPLPRWPEDGLLQAIAAENNVSETAFTVPDGEDYRLRWFTPTAEVDLCGHATLAAGHVVLRILQGTREAVCFRTASGPIEVVRDEGERLAMDFPSLPPEPVPDAGALAEALGDDPVEVLAAKDWLAVFDRPGRVTALAPDMERLRRLDRRGVIVTAPAGDRTGEADAGQGPPPDFVSRFFAPKVGVPEDPVTGSAHCTLAPYWSRRTGRARLRGRQVSERGGEVVCRIAGDRVSLSGRAVLYLEGWITC